MDDPTVIIRMYRGPQPANADDEVQRGLLGDCFLLQLQMGDAKSFILIDCGVLTGTPDARGVMRAIADDIRKTSGGRLDLVIATHQHADHLSGFAHAASVFFGGGMHIDTVWMAWTEDPDDRQASDLRERFDHSRDKLKVIAEQVGNRRLGSAFASAPRGLLTGLDAFTAAAPVTKTTRMTTGAVLDRLRRAARDTRYLSPGAVLATPGDVSLTAIVLAPPRSERLFKDRPTKRGDEVFAAPPGSADALLDEALIDPRADRSSHSPFAPAERRLTETEVMNPKVDDEVRRWLRDRYYGAQPPDPLSKAEDADERERRRIDGDWLAAAGDFALKLDSDTNNTSLVIAFALPGGDFMLFPGDAQVGNWESWHDQRYTLDGRTLEAADILARTRFYKVGHHGSHNATLKGRGLALMTHPALVAMVSTDEAFARLPARGWEMPAGNTKRALLDATRGRLIRGDRRWRDDPDVRPYPVSRDFLARLDEADALFVDYRICGDGKGTTP